MRDVVPFTLPNGEIVLIEGDAGIGFEPASTRWRERVEDAAQSFEDAAERVKDVASSLMTKLLDMPERPDQVTVEFGVKVAGKVGVVITSGEAEANLKVTLSWTRSPS